MRQLAILTLLTVLLPGLPAIGAADSGESPKAVVPSPIHDFEEVPQGPELEHTWVVENQGTAVLEIERVVSDCGCTVTEFDRVIAAGETGKVHATIDSTMLSGPVSRSIVVFTNDPGNPRLRLTFKAMIQPQLHVTPGRARYSTVRGEDKPATIRQVVFAPDGSSFTVTEVETGSPHLTATFRRATEGEAESAPEDAEPWIVDLRYDYNSAPVGPIIEEVLIHTDHPLQDKIRVPVSGFVRPALWATPHNVQLGDVDLSEPYHFVVVVQNFLSEPIEITGVDSELSGLETKVTPVVAGHKFNLTIGLPQDLPEGPFDTTLVIHTSNAKQPTLEVPLSGTVL